MQSVCKHKKQGQKSVLSGACSLDRVSAVVAQFHYYSFIQHSVRNSIPSAHADVLLFSTLPSWIPAIDFLPGAIIFLVFVFRDDLQCCHSISPELSMVQLHAMVNVEKCSE